MARLKEIQSETKQSLINSEQNQSRIISCEVKKGKLITQLDDGREISLAINLLTKWGVLDKEIKPEQLKKYKLQNEGRYIYFPNIDDILPARIISEGLFKSCWER